MNRKEAQHLVIELRVDSKVLIQLRKGLLQTHLELLTSSTTPTTTATTTPSRSSCSSSSSSSTSGEGSGDSRVCSTKSEMLLTWGRPMADPKGFGIGDDWRIGNDLATWRSNSIA